MKEIHRPLCLLSEKASHTRFGHARHTRLTARLYRILFSLSLMRVQDGPCYLNEPPN